MSARIETTLAVLERVRDRHRKGMSSAELRRLRTAAVNDVASDRGVASTTVSNKYRREMRPDLDGTSEFDEVVRAWLFEGSNELERILRKHAVTHRDLTEIDEFFSSRSFDTSSFEQSRSKAPDPEPGARSPISADRPQEDRSRFQRALVYATQLHARQTRKDPEKTPYIAHLLGVCSLVLEAGGNEAQAIAALLHDAAEDQGGHERLAEIRESFGVRVADLVAACTDTFQTPKPEWQTRKERYVSSVGDQSEMALLVVCADKLYNARTILRDHRIHGDAVFDRFTGGKDGTLWYYRAIVDSLQESELDSWLVDELRWTVATLEYWGGTGL